MLDQQPHTSDPVRHLFGSIQEYRLAIRIKSQWHEDDSQRSPAEIGGAAAFIAWRLALDKAKNLHGEQFVYDADTQRLAVIAEYLIFQVQIVDRMAHDMMDQQERSELVTGMVLKLAEHYQDNAQDLLGPGQHDQSFIALFNQRAGEYAEFNFSSDGPSYPFMRHLGYEIQQIMGESQENRWVIDQVMDADAPEVYKQLSRAVRNLLD